jgi:head-tail adaptor
MTGALGAFYPSRGVIQRPFAGEDAYGQPIEGWQDLHTGVPCALAPVSAQESQAQSGPYAVATHKVALAGPYPDVEPRMRVLVDGAAYPIEGVQRDSRGATATLLVRRVTS